MNDGVVGGIREIFRSPEHMARQRPFEATVAIGFADSRATIAETLTSLRCQTGGRHFEVLLVSNATTDDSVSVAKAAGAGLPMRIVECESVGYDANARNVSMREAASDNIMLLDSDDAVNGSYVFHMANALRDSPLVTSMWSLSKFNGDLYPELSGNSPGSIVELPFRQRGWTYAPAGTIGLRRQVFTTIGGFRPDLSYAANDEWCFRAYAAGYQVKPVRDAVVDYRLRRSSKAYLVQRYRWGLWEVAADKAARAYGLPPRPILKALGVGRYAKLLMDAATARTRFGWHNLLGSAGNAVGHLVGSIRFRHLDL